MIRARTVQVDVSKLRKVFGDGVLVTRAGGYVLQVRAANGDSGRFEALVADGAGRAGG